MGGTYDAAIGRFGALEAALPDMLACLMVRHLCYDGWRGAAACSQRPTDKKRQRKPCETWGTASALGRHIEICLVGFLIRR